MANNQSIVDPVISLLKRMSIRMFYKRLNWFCQLIRSVWFECAHTEIWKGDRNSLKSKAYEMSFGTLQKSAPCTQRCISLKLQPEQ